MESQSIKTHHEKPWLCKCGKTLSDETLRTSSQSWDSTTWDRYLRNLDSSLSESLVPVFIYQKHLERQGSIFEFTQSCANPELQNKIHMSLSQLTPKQRRIIEMTFWDSMSERDIAEKLGISRSTVKTLKKRALLKLLPAQSLPIPAHA
ncbi:MAG: sigma-70 family RNA polymerase sigma factor [Bdellovibrionaceae bacterium]|nr:sigma-70 family RNA polymerase sigma factor [Pseudobdellovibrionaceae bacterium]